MSNTPSIQFPEPLGFFFDTEYCRYRVAYGGRSSGKSWTAAQALVVCALQSKSRIQTIVCSATVISAEFTDICFGVKAVLCFDFCDFRDIFRRNTTVQQY